MASYKISIITATLNAENDLPTLIDSLESQVDLDFEWVVCDGGSLDRTRSIVENVRTFPVVFDEKKDFGIYDALNRGIELSEGDYYLVVGADDRLNPDTIKNFKDALSKNPKDLISACVKVNGKVVRPKKNKGRIFGISGETSGHAVSLLIRKGLHREVGLYTNRFPICADQLFVLSCISRGFTVGYEAFVAGEYSREGLSSRDVIGSLTEGCRVRSEVYGFDAIQFIILILRLVKNYRRLKTK